MELSGEVEGEPTVLWETRDRATDALKILLSKEGQTIDRAFALLDELVDRFQAAEGSDQLETYTLVSGLTLIKARNLAQGCLSLTLDGLAQEAGALLRPMIETLELIIYFREDPSRVEEAVQGKLPSAGLRAQKIQGKFKGLREHLNEHASHFSFTLPALIHLISLKDFKWKLSQSFDESALRTNLGMIFVFLALLTLEGASALSVVGLLSDEMADRVEAFRNEGRAVFNLTPSS